MLGCTTTSHSKSATVSSLPSGYTSLAAYCLAWDLWLGQLNKIDD
jgi:hypothetical protein